MTEKERELRKIAYEEGFSQGKILLSKVKYEIDCLRIASRGLGQKERGIAYKKSLDIVERYLQKGW